MLQTVLGVIAADNAGSQVGKNIQDLLQGFSTPVFLGLVGVIALMLLTGRKVGQLAIFLVVALGVGILVLNPDGFANIVRSIGDTISKGV